MTKLPELTASAPVLAPAYRTKVLSLLHDRHKAALRDETFTLEAVREHGDVLVTLTLAKRDQTQVYTMQAVISRDKYSALSEEQALDLTIDFLDWYVGEYLREDRDVFLPLDWKMHVFGDLEVMARGEVRNAFLDDAADAWLRGERPDVEAQWKALKGKRA